MGTRILRIVINKIFPLLRSHHAEQQPIDSLNAAGIISTVIQS